MLLLYSSAVLFTFYLLLQETLLSLTNRKTHLCNCNGVADLKTPTPFPYVLPCKFSRSVLKGGGIITGFTGELPKVGSAETPFSLERKRG